MYTIPEGQIAFSDIEKFCLEEPEEDLILDYKVDWPADLSRILCGMANVQGGMVLIGVGTQKGTRKPVWPPPGVTGTDDSLHQRAIQIAYDNIYPPVLPQIDVVRFPTDLDKAIVVIRVDASRLLHATDQRRRVYIRVADHSRGIENELANISQLEWLFQQRQKSVELRQAIVTRASERTSRYCSSDAPTLTAWLAPTFPLSTFIKNPAELLQIARKFGTSVTGLRFSNNSVPKNSNWRTTAEGIFVLPMEGERFYQYLELCSYGAIYLKQEMRIYKDRYADTPGLQLIGVSDVLGACDAFLIFAADFYNEILSFGPLQLSVSLQNMEGVILDQRFAGPQNIYAEAHATAFSQDNLVSLYLGEVRANIISENRDDILKDIYTNLMWAFGFPDSREKLAEYIHDAFQQ